MPDVRVGAEFSEDRMFRYALYRDLGSVPPLCVIGLNPSTADELVDDPTIRRCRGYSQSWGLQGLVMLNLFAYRSTDPKPMFSMKDEAIGPRNDEFIVKLAGETVRDGGIVLAAWGAFEDAMGRARDVRAMLRDAGVKLHVLGFSKMGHPRHPLYMKRDIKPMEWDPSDNMEST